MHRKIWLLAGCMAIGTATLAPVLAPALAQQQGQQSDYVTGVEVQTPAGPEVYLLMPSGTWVRMNAKGEVTGEFFEIDRLGAGLKVGIYLLELTTKEKLGIDTEGETVFNVLRETTGRVTAISTIRNREIAVNRPPAAPPIAPAAPQVAQNSAAPPAGNPAAATGEFDPLVDPFADPAAGQSAPVQQAANPASGTNAGPTGGAFRASVANNQTQTAQQSGTIGWRPNQDVGTGATAPTGQYAGPWVSLRNEVRSAGDGLKEPMKWQLPETILVSNPTDAVLTIYFDDPAAGLPIQTRKTGPGTYKGFDHTVKITPVGANFEMEISGLGQVKQFKMATTNDGTLSRARFENSNGEDRKSSWNASTFAAGYDYMLYSYRGEKMNLMKADAGRAKEIFMLPGSTDYTLAPFLSKNLPFGLRGDVLGITSVRQLETMISNAASFQKSTSYNFGGGGDGGKGASLGIEYSASQTAGRSSSSERLRGQSYARIEKYALLQDKANQKLDPFFESNIRKFVAGQITAEQFIADYGTHYAMAIHFGGIAEATREMTTAQLVSHAEKNFSVSGEGSLKGASLKGGYSEVESKSDTSGSMFSSSSFESRGGDGGMERASWSVNDSNGVPVRYDLRPLSDLISPVFFPKEFEASATFASYSNARRELDGAITRYMARFPALPNTPIGPRLYRLQFHSIQCLDNVGDGGEPAVLYGQIAAVVNHADGIDSPVLLKAEEGAPITLPCGPSASPYQIQTAPMFVASARNGTLNHTPENPTDQNPLAFFQIVAGELFEQDPTALDYDDELDDERTPIILNEWSADKPRTDLVGLRIGDPKGKIGPTLVVKVSWKEIQ